MWRFWISVAAILPLAGCAEPRQAAVAPPPQPRPVEAAFHSGALPPPAQCALFAREFTGIHIRGNAYAWWDLAAGQYPRGDLPKVDAVLVLRSTAQLPLGHVAIVKKTVGPREITVTHANWGKDDPTRRIIHDSTAVVDVSPRNDWTALRFWNAPAHAFGKVYAAYGFIYPKAYTADSRPVW
jgi:surface antigen